MNQIEYMDFKPDQPIAVYRLVGEMPLEAGMRRVGEMIAIVAGLRITRMLMDITGSSGYDIPTLATRAALMRHWAAAAGGIVRPAFVCAPEFIDPERFGLILAAQLGMVANVFDDESDALEWLRLLP